MPQDPPRNEHFHEVEVSRLVLREPVFVAAAKSGLPSGKSSVRAASIRIFLSDMRYLAASNADSRSPTRSCAVTYPGGVGRIRFLV